MFEYLLASAATPNLFGTVGLLIRRRLPGAARIAQPQPDNRKAAKETG
jgi:hypothetical protein